MAIAPFKKTKKKLQFSCKEKPTLKKKIAISVEHGRATGKAQYSDHAWESRARIHQAEDAEAGPWSTSRSTEMQKAD